MSEYKMRHAPRHHPQLQGEDLMKSGSDDSLPAGPGSTLSTKVASREEDKVVDGAPFLVHKRIAVLGANGVGKSALCIRCCFSRFEEKYMQTFQDSYQWQPIVNGVRYDVSIEDCDGQDGNSEFAIRNTTGIDGYVLVFSVCDEYSFQVVKTINEKLLDTLNVIERVGTAEIPRVLVGNQIDVVEERRVSRKEAESWARDHGIPYLESSAYTAQNTQEVFCTVLKLIKENLDNSHNPHDATQPCDVTASPTLSSPNTGNQTCCVQ